MNLTFMCLLALNFSNHFLGTVYMMLGLCLLQDIYGDSWDANAWVPLYNTQSHCEGSNTLMYNVL